LRPFRIEHLLAVAWLSCTSVVASGAANSPPSDAALTLSPYTFVSSKGDSVAAEMGRLRVPERHGQPGSRMVELAFVRFRCTSPTAGAPIVYLAGGPGGSGIVTARGTRFPLFMAMRALGDVIALDQRGTGISKPNLECPQHYRLPLDRPLSRQLEIEQMTDSVHACATHWRNEGVDLEAYNTNESADDLASLADALGASRLRLWAISYGTHLSLTAIRRHPQRIERAILAGIEGPDHTLKLPSNTERLLDRIAKLAAQDSTVHAAVPDLVGALRGALASLDRAPARVRIPNTATPVADDSVEVVLGRYDVAGQMADLLGTAEAQAYFPGFVRAAARGDYVLLARVAMAFGNRGGGEVGNAMSYAMDCASGATAARRRQIEREAKTTTLGDATNGPQNFICDAWGVHELGDDFRAPVRSDVPVLFISGTQDLNTPPSNAEEIAKGFPNGKHLIIDGVAHSDPLFLSSPEILKRMLAFMSGAPVSTEVIRVPFKLRLEVSDLERFLR
jgi:pimeloyl-ACP methyl ester carboxylesterase